VTTIVPAAGASSIAGAEGPAPPEARASDLLPAPGGGVAYGSALGSVYELLSRQRDVGLRLSQGGVAVDQQLHARALADELAAVQREQGNQRGSGAGFFDSLGKLAADVVGDLLDGRAGALPGDVANDAAAAWNSPRFWSDLQKGLEQVAAAAAAVGQVALVVGGPAGAAVAVVAGGVDAVVLAGAGAAEARSGAFAADALEAHADVVSRKGDVAFIERQVTALLDEAKSNDQSLGSALDGVASAISVNNRALVSSTALRG
jgi:hypothetical protein